MQQFEHEGILYEELPNGQARVIGPAGGAGPVYGSPKRPAPQTPAQEQGDRLTVQQKQGDIARLPGQMEGDQLSNARTRYELQTKPTYDRFGAIDKIRDGYRQDKRILKYEEAIPIYVSAIKSPEDAAGDNLLVNAVAKVSDPTTGVQQREGASWEDTQANLETLKARMLKEFGSDGYGNFTPEARLRIRNALTVRAKALAEQYALARTEYKQYLRASRIPDTQFEAIFGPHVGGPYKGQIQEWLDSVQGNNAPRINDRTQAGFDLQQDPSIASMTPEQTAAYQAWWKANPNPTPDQLNQFFVAVGLGPAPNAQEIIAAAREGRGISTTIENQIPQRIQERLDRRLENTGDGGAAVAGGADTITMGTFDELSALGDAVGDAFQGQGFDYSGNLAANRQFQEGLQDQHGGAYLGGQIAGGLVLPTFGASTPAQLAKVGAGYGAAYGAGSGEGMGRLGGAALGATAGAAIGGTLGKASQFVAGRRQPREIPPLVGEDGRLNEPLEALRPGQRVAAAREFGIDLPLGAATDRGGALLEKGLDILPGSAGAMNDARRVTERQVSGAVEQVAGRFGASKTLNEAGGEAQRGAREWMGRFEATASKAYDAIPISPKAQASVQATVGTIDNILARFSSNPELAAQMNSPKLQQMREAIAKGLSWEDLKALRSRIGYEIGEQRFSDSPTKDDLRAVYAALSEDMKATAAAMGPRATQAFNRANSFYRQGQQRIDQALVTLLGNDGAKSPEAAAKAIQAMTQGGKGTGDLAKLAQVRAATIKSGAWDEIAGALIRIGGQPADSPGRTFSPETFVRWYADMAEPARKMLFKPELRKSLDQFVAVNQRLAGTNALRNTSNTAPGLLAGGVMGTMGVAALNPLLGAKLLGGMAANFGMAKVWTNPRFVQWATGYTKAVASGNERAVKQQIGRLSKLGTTNPELRGVIETIVRNSANDNVGPRLAADSVGDDQQGR